MAGRARREPCACRRPAAALCPTPGVPPSTRPPRGACAAWTRALWGPGSPERIGGQWRPEGMRIALGCDHAGFALKGPVVAALEAVGHAILDLGTFSEDP